MTRLLRGTSDSRLGKFNESPSYDTSCPNNSGAPWWHSEADTVRRQLWHFHRDIPVQPSERPVVEVCIFNKVIILESNNDGASAGGNAEVKSKHLVLLAALGRCLLRREIVITTGRPDHWIVATQSHNWSVCLLRNYTQPPPPPPPPLLSSYWQGRVSTAVLPGCFPPMLLVCARHVLGLM